MEDSREGVDKFGGNLIILADCRHVIELEFFLGTEQDRVNSLKKIALLIDTFTRFRDALAKEIALIEKGE